jgi:hypothetical protein
LSDGWWRGADWLWRRGGGGDSAADGRWQRCRSVLEPADLGWRFGGENGGGRGGKRIGLVLQRKVTLVTDVWAFEHLGLHVSHLFYLIRGTTR